MDQSQQDQQKKLRKKVGYRTSKQFLRNVFRRNPAYRQAGIPHTARPRSLGGHR